MCAEKLSTTESSATATRSPKKGKKYFSISEANRALIYISPIVEEIADCYKVAVDIREQIEMTEGTREQEKLQDDYDKAMDRLNDLLEELHQVGVELKDFERGLLDFPAVHEDREIYLCWHRGEQSVCAWHEIEAGYAGRQDVSLLEQGC